MHDSETEATAVPLVSLAAGLGIARAAHLDHPVVELQDVEVLRAGPQG